MVSPRVFSKEDVRNEVSPISPNTQREILETSSKDSLQEPIQPNNDPVVLKPTIIPIQPNAELVLERKKKQKPDQLIFVKTLLTRVRDHNFKCYFLLHSLDWAEERSRKIDRLRKFFT